ncbi:hypothetical protein HO133_006867 [Letharia lupina]|uniref:Uncharacterized protein n=1 Tax=Letharia lupina TaxID=560253 RepID=A0A8H6C600_9LECA|nr:uncharacterized protein HO133_006867 [Letharia lupina]KAF6217529.1 hypothetical protein HO133_006867 [Letharia lupina]
MGNSTSLHVALFGGVPDRKKQAWVRPKAPRSENNGQAGPSTSNYPGPPGKMQEYDDEAGLYDSSHPPPDSKGPPRPHTAQPHTPGPEAGHSSPTGGPKPQHPSRMPTYHVEDEEFPNHTPGPGPRLTGSSQVGPPIPQAQPPKRQKQPPHSRRPSLTKPRSSSPHSRPPGDRSRQHPPPPPRHSHSAAPHPHSHTPHSAAPNPHPHPRSRTPPSAPPHPHGRHAEGGGGERGGMRHPRDSGDAVRDPRRITGRSRRGEEGV